MRVQHFGRTFLRLLGDPSLSISLVEGLITLIGDLILSSLLARIARGTHALVKV